MRGRLIRGAFGDSEDLYRKDKDSGEDGGWFDGPGDSGWDPTDVKARESIIKFAGVDTEEEEMEREPREMVRQKIMMMMSGHSSKSPLYQHQYHHHPPPGEAEDSTSEGAEGEGAQALWVADQVRG